MKKVSKTISTIVMAAVLLVGVSNVHAGVIVNLKDANSSKACEELKSSTGSTKFDSGVIVNLTGVIVNFTGVIVNLTGVIVNFSDPKSADCGFIPTSD